MDSDESIRMRVVGELERVLGPEAALYIMSNLPVVNWHELSTKADLAAVSADVAALAASTKAEFTAIRDEMATKADLRVFVAELRSEIATVRTEMYQGLISQTKWFVGTNVALVGIALTAAKLIL